MDFRLKNLENTIISATKSELINLYCLGKKYEDVLKDCRESVKNITEWLELVFKGTRNNFGISYTKFIAAE